MTILKHGSEGVHLELYPGARDTHTLNSTWLVVWREQARIILSFLHMEIHSSLQASRIPNCVFQHARLSLFLKQGVLSDFNIFV